MVVECPRAGVARRAQGWMQLHRLPRLGYQVGITWPGWARISAQARISVAFRLGYAMMVNISAWVRLG